MATSSPNCASYTTSCRYKLAPVSNGSRSTSATRPAPTSRKPASLRRSIQGASTGPCQQTRKGRMGQSPKNILQRSNSPNRRGLVAFVERSSVSNDIVHATCLARSRQSRNKSVHAIEQMSRLLANATAAFVHRPAIARRRQVANQLLHLQKELQVLYDQGQNPGKSLRRSDAFEGILAGSGVPVSGTATGNCIYQKAAPQLSPIELRTITRNILPRIAFPQLSSSPEP